MPKKNAANRMVEVIRKAITDKDIMQCLTPNDLAAVLNNAVDNLTPSDVRGFIYRCITNREVNKALLMADRAIDFALGMKKAQNTDAYRDIVGAAVGTLSMMSSTMPAVKDKITSLLHHPHPEIVVAVIENLGHSSNLDNFNRVADLLLQPNAAVAGAAAEYVEACARDAAFRKRRDLYVIERSAEEFLRSALLRLESVYRQVRADENRQNVLAKRLAILVAMMYNEILDSTDWKRFRKEEVDERIYYALEQYLLEKIGPDAKIHLPDLLASKEVETGVKRSALHTLGRLSKQPAMRAQMVSWLPSFIEAENDDVLVSLAESILNACVENKPFSVLMCLPAVEEMPSSIVPRSAGAPLKRDDDEGEFY